MPIYRVPLEMLWEAGRQILRRILYRKTALPERMSRIRRLVQNQIPTESRSATRHMVPGSLRFPDYFYNTGSVRHTGSPGKIERRILAVHFDNADKSSVS